MDGIFSPYLARVVALVQKAELIDAGYDSDSAS
jgi:hypothetical protein